MRRNSISARELGEDYGVPLKQIIEWIEAGHLHARKATHEKMTWYTVPLTELIVFHGLRKGLSPEEARAESNRELKHLRERFIHTPVGTEVSKEELEKHRG